MSFILKSEEYPDAGEHIDPETLARLAEGRIEKQERANCIKHLNRCQSCYDILQQTLTDLGRESPLPWKRSRPSYALAAGIILVLLIGGGILFRSLQGPTPVVIASLVMDQDLKAVLLEDKSLTWEKGNRVNRLAALLRDRGVNVKVLDKVILASPYKGKKGLSRDLFAPREILKVRIEGDTAYIEVAEEKREKP